MEQEIRSHIQKPGGIKSHNYIRVTVCSLHARMQSHMAGHNRGKLRNPLVKHDKEHHNRLKQDNSVVTVTREQALLPLIMNKAVLSAHSRTASWNFLEWKTRTR